MCLKNWDLLTVPIGFHNFHQKTDIDGSVRLRIVS